MADALSIRPARRCDAAEIAILVDLASHGFASWLWYGAVLEGCTDTAMEYGCMRMQAGGPEGWQNTLIAEWGGEIAGASIAYDVDESVHDAVAGHPVLEPLIELQRRIVGNRFIDSVGVYRRYRGKGIGRALVRREIERAGDLAVSLITESHNETALSLYRANGFAEVTRLEAVPLDENSKKHDWVLLTRNVT